MELFVGECFMVVSAATLIGGLVGLGGDQA